MANGINNRVFNMMEAIVDQTDVDFSVDFDTFDDAVVPLPEEDREYGRPLELPFWSEAGYPEKSTAVSSAIASIISNTLLFNPLAILYLFRSFYFFQLLITKPLELYTCQLGKFCSRLILKV